MSSFAKKFREICKSLNLFAKFQNICLNDTYISKEVFLTFIRFLSVSVTHKRLTHWSEWSVPIGGMWPQQTLGSNEMHYKVGGITLVPGETSPGMKEISSHWTQKRTQFIPQREKASASSATRVMTYLCQSDQTRRVGEGGRLELDSSSGVEGVTQA